MTERLHGFYNDDGTPMNPDLVPKPSLCVSCKHDSDPAQERFCMLNRMDQQSGQDFKCDVYETKRNYPL